ncbi:sugar phosphate nucleotidyltransferase [Halostella sp. PRR32]|uniref:mannose-1-phosphate guanylyltransferase n=1 Tax=Halostella sp. PRR32 TaxID=3098147 RepID=UPI002B1E0C49|nr:sugar phosphate nucleotidyltransferase [Halostella sp. PRR32]
MDRPIVAVILAGGTGTRLYPASRSDRPKQFQSFGGDRSLLARTADRVDFADETVVLTRDAYADAVPAHAPDADVLVEPAPRDTGPALTYAAARLRERVDDAVLLCVPSDHRLRGDFESPARRAARVAVETDGLVTLGVEPTRPATEYGYVEPRREQDGYAPVRRFREKPDRETAAELVDDCYWNAGIFAWTPDAFLREARDSPLSTVVAAAENGGETAPNRRDADPLATAVRETDPVSVDYAVLERTDDAYVVPVSFEWDDLGSWDALERVVGGDDNAVLGDALTIDAADNVVASDGDTHVSVVGADDLVVAAYGDRVLVVPKDDAQRVREVVKRLRDAGEF